VLLWGWRAGTVGWARAYYTVETSLGLQAERVDLVTH
jgi:hypothetical protein